MQAPMNLFLFHHLKSIDNFSLD